MFFRGMHIVKTLQRMKLGKSKIVEVKKRMTNGENFYMMEGVQILINLRG